MLDYISSITNYVEEFLDRPIFINQYPKLDFCSNNLFSLQPTQKYLRQIYLTEELWRFLQPGLISMTYEKKLGLSNVNHERKHKLIMDLWVLIMNSFNFTLYSISFLLESSLLFALLFVCKTFFIAKLFLIEQGIVFN